MCLGVRHISYLKNGSSLDHVGGRVCLMPLIREEEVMSVYL